MSLYTNNEIVAPIYLTKGQIPTINIDSCIYLGKGVIGNDYLNTREIDKESLGDNYVGSHENNRVVKAKSETVSVFAIDFDKLRFSIQEELDTVGQWLRLREVTTNLSSIDASILALAKGLVHWHKSHCFCGLCGHANNAVEAGHAKRCSDCRNMTFPRTDPAVIMLVEKIFSDGIPRCLLGRQASWMKGVYSTLAGFVDPGETLEQAVIREVIEEAGIVVENPQYITSQPWPFPASIMLGFTAVAITDKVDVSHDSLESAQWFSREQLSQFSVKGVDRIEGEDELDSSYKMSSNDSISSHLINAWKNKEIGQY